MNIRAVVIYYCLPHLDPWPLLAHSIASNKPTPLISATHPFCSLNWICIWDERAGCDLMRRGAVSIWCAMMTFQCGNQLSYLSTFTEYGGSINVAPSHKPLPGFVILPYIKLQENSSHKRRFLHGIRAKKHLFHDFLHAPFMSITLHGNRICNLTLTLASRRPCGLAGSECDSVWKKNIMVKTM